jgi:hypothetical protein
MITALSQRTGTIANGFAIERGRLFMILPTYDSVKAPTEEQRRPREQIGPISSIGHWAPIRRHKTYKCYLIRNAQPPTEGPGPIGYEALERAQKPQRPHQTRADHRPIRPIGPMSPMSPMSPMPEGAIGPLGSIGHEAWSEPVGRIRSRSDTRRSSGP